MSDAVASTAENEEGDPAQAGESSVPRPFSPIVDLEPSMSSAAALRRIHRELLRRIEENRDGVGNRLPGESLHDFRVAIRRTRVGLRRVKRVYPAKEVEHFSAEFGWLSSLTGPARDLEVYLCSIESYRDDLGDPAMTALDPFLDFLRTQEDLERSRCTEGIESERYASLIDGWTAFLDQPGSSADGPANASRPVHEFAGRVVAKACRRFLERAAALEAGSSPADFHRVRLDGKKFRYLVEFFGGLFDEEQVSAILAKMRTAQDALGTINDLRVQAEWLGRFPGPDLAAVRPLRAHLQGQESRERQSFLDSFATSLGPRSPVESLLQTFARPA